MDVMSVSYMPGDPMLVEKIVCELKSQGIFDLFRKECISDVDTKPAYQNLRQRVEGSVGNFLSKQHWKPDMNKNQVREMLRKHIQDSGFLETGVERIVDQVVNPKMNSVFLPKVTEVVYKYFGLEKPKAQPERPLPSILDITLDNLLPKDLEAVSPDSVPSDKKDNNPNTSQELDISKNESTSPETSKEQDKFIQEENSMDSHLSGFSGLVSHDSNHSEGPPIEVNLDLSKNSSDERSLSIEYQKMEVIDDSHDLKVDETSLSSIKLDENKEIGVNKNDIDKEDKKERKDDKSKKDEGRRQDKDDKRDKDRHRTDKHKSRSDSRSEKKDSRRRTDKDKKDKYSSKDTDRSKDRSSSRKHSSSSKSDKEKHDKDRKDNKDKNEKDRDRYKSSSSKHSSSSRDRHSKDKLSRDKDKSRDKSRDTKSSRDDKSKSDEKDKRSSSHRDKDKDKDKKDLKKKTSSKDDHYSSKIRPERRSTDRDSNDGSGLKSSSSNCDSNSSSQTSNNQTEKPRNGSHSSTTDSANSDSVEPVETGENKYTTNLMESLSSNGNTLFKLIKPKIASNIYEARKIMKIRKELKKIERDTRAREQAVYENQLRNEQNCLSEDNPNEIIESCAQEETILDNLVVDSVVPSISVSVDAWDALEAKLNQNVNFDTYYDPDTPPKTDEIVINDTEKVEEQNVTELKLISANVDDVNSCLSNSLERSHKIVNFDVSKMEDEEISIVTNLELGNSETDMDVDESGNTFKEGNLESKENNSITSKLPELIQQAGKINIENTVELIVADEIIQDDNVTQSNISLNLKKDEDLLHFIEGVNDLAKNTKYRTNMEHIMAKLKKEINLIETNIELSIFNNIPPAEIKEVNKENHVVSLKRKMVETRDNIKKTRNNSVKQDHDDKFTFPLSPAESEKSIEKRSDSEGRTENVVTPINKTSVNTKRYSNEDLYKPRPVITRSTRRRGAKIE